LGQASDAFKKIIPQLLGWGLLATGLSYIGFGIYNDLNWGAPWACPGPFFPPEYTPLDCITEGTILVEIPIGAVLLVIGIVLLLIDRMYIKE
jgi:hypothetical protein